MFKMVWSSQNQHLFSWLTCKCFAKIVALSYAHGCQWEWVGFSSYFNNWRHNPKVQYPHPFKLGYKKIIKPQYINNYFVTYMWILQTFVKMLRHILWPICKYYTWFQESKLYWVSKANIANFLLHHEDFTRHYVGIA